MSTQLVIASDNAGKIRELKDKIGAGIQLLSMRDIGFTGEIPEPFHTFHENAHAKADAIYRFSGNNVFADDSGICVPSLNGAPGVDSAHYCGRRDDEQNLQLLLRNLEGSSDRSAYYIAVICLIWQGEVHYFEGRCHGTILYQKQGDGGFGYDPIFQPNGYHQSFGQIPLATKNLISHRALATQKMLDFLAAAI